MPARRSGIARKPRWDAEARQLWWGGKVIKTYRNDAAKQRGLLQAFEDQGWPTRIENPLAGGNGVGRKERFRNTVKNLNRGLKHGSICFTMGGKATAVRWSADT